MITKVPNERVLSLLEGARRRLVEIGTRNRLIHVNRTSKRANALNIINGSADSVFGILRANGQKMKLVATTRNSGDDEGNDELSLPFIEDEDFIESRHTDQTLETRLTTDSLQKRLLRLVHDSKIAWGLLAVLLARFVSRFVITPSNKPSNQRWKTVQIKIRLYSLMNVQRTTTLVTRAEATPPCAIRKKSGLGTMMGMVYERCIATL